uniref:Lipocalin n=1 Tax=Rhipicephalus zambeziensis TaxID=60191 RepID=A0A224YH71_9ACAR
MTRAFLCQMIFLSVTVCMFPTSSGNLTYWEQHKIKFKTQAENVKWLINNEKNLVLLRMPRSLNRDKALKCLISNYLVTGIGYSYRDVYFEFDVGDISLICRYALKIEVTVGSVYPLIRLFSNGSQRLPEYIHKSYSAMYASTTCMVLRDDATAMQEKPFFYLWTLKNTPKENFKDCLNVYKFTSKVKTVIPEINCSKLEAKIDKVTTSCSINSGAIKGPLSISGTAGERSICLTIRK